MENQHLAQPENTVLVPHWNSRSALLWGNDVLAKLLHKHVLVVGLGGVGSFAAEFLVRGGIGALTIVDGDVVDTTNRNRQLPALQSTIGKNKTDIMAARLLDINPELRLTVHNTFVMREITDQILEPGFDYLIDAIDTIAPKVGLLRKAYERGIPVVSSMGAGGKTDPTQIEISDIDKVHHCRLARYVKKRLHRAGIRKGITAVFSPEPVSDEALQLTENTPNKVSYFGTASYIPALFGGHCASVVLRDLMGVFPR
jgi:tRNA A37 threonylcarbamoyladenosine dehydratase